MSVVAIIAEYNPFHNGHEYQINSIRKMFSDCPNSMVIAVMSGSLVQRGEFALISKYHRAKAALLCGADAVFELPSVYSCAPANLFASSAVSIINALGGVDYLCFGSESGDIDRLKFAADNADNIVLDGSSRNASYPRVFHDAFAGLYGEERAQVFKGSNDILAVEYLRAIIKHGSTIEPIAIKRGGQDGDDYITSASRIRAAVHSGTYDTLRDFMPEQSANLLSELIITGKTADINNISSAVISHIKRLDASQIAQFAEIIGGIEHRIKKSRALTHSDLVNDLRSKHCTISQVNRMVLNVFFEITREQQQSPPPFTVLLGANEKGRLYLNKIRKSAKIKIITKPADSAHIPELMKNLFIDDVYKLALGDNSGEVSAVLEKPVIL